MSVPRSHFEFGEPNDSPGLATNYFMESNGICLRLQIRRCREQVRVVEPCTDSSVVLVLLKVPTRDQQTYSIGFFRIHVGKHQSGGIGAHLRNEACGK